MVAQRFQSLQLQDFRSIGQRQQSGSILRKGGRDARNNHPFRTSRQSRKSGAFALRTTARIPPVGSGRAHGAGDRALHCRQSATQHRFRHLLVAAGTYARNGRRNPHRTQRSARNPWRGAAGTHRRRAHHRSAQRIPWHAHRLRRRCALEKRQLEAGTQPMEAKLGRKLPVDRASRASVRPRKSGGASGRANHCSQPRIAHLELQAHAGNRAPGT